MTGIHYTAAGSPYMGDHSEYLRAVARMIRAAGARVGTGDPTDLAELLELRAHVDAAIAAALVAQRESHSLGELATALGVSRQAVHKMHTAAVAHGL